jgi:hypothetical protein
MFHKTQARLDLAGLPTGLSVQDGYTALAFGDLVVRIDAPVPRDLGLTETSMVRIRANLDEGCWRACEVVLLGERASQATPTPPPAPRSRVLASTDESPFATLGRSRNRGK